MEVLSVFGMQSMDPAKNLVRTEKSAGITRGTSFAAILSGEQQKCPYSLLAKDGMIEYNGVFLTCDYKRNALCLGDMSDPKKVLRINLPSGGSLNVNVDNFGDISKLAGMFSPEDLNAILRAIHEYNHCTSKLNEIEEEEAETAEGILTE